MADLAGATVSSSQAAVIDRPRTGPDPAAALQSSPATTGVCEFLDWDSKFFGIRIARVTGHRLDAERATEIARAVRDQSIDCLYFLQFALSRRSRNQGISTLIAPHVYAGAAATRSPWLAHTRTSDGTSLNSTASGESVTVAWPYSR